MGFESSSSSSIDGGILDVLEADFMELLLGPDEDRTEISSLGRLLPYPSSHTVDTVIWRLRFFGSVSASVTESHWIPAS